MDQNSIAVNPSTGSKKKLIYLFFLIIMLLFLVTIFSFAYFQRVFSDDGFEGEDINAGNILVVFKENSNIYLTNAIPLADREGLLLDGSFLAQFSVTNEGSVPVNFEVSLIRIKGDTNELDSSLLNYAFVNKGVIAKQMDVKQMPKSDEVVLIANQVLDPKQSRSYDLRVWVDKRVGVEEGSNKSYKAKISIKTIAVQGGAAID